MRYLILTASLLNTGCALMMEPLPDDAYMWEKTRQAVPYTAHVVPQAAVQAYCSHESAYVMACAYYDSDQCWIFASSKRAMSKMLNHEIRHCEGWDHKLKGNL